MAEILKILVKHWLFFHEGTVYCDSPHIFEILPNTKFTF